MKQPTSNLKTLSLAVTAGIMAMALTACGGSSSSSTSTTSNQKHDAPKTPTAAPNKPSTPTGTANNQAKFSETATWVVETPPQGNTQSCYDFDGKKSVDCQSPDWDVKMVNTGRGVQFFSNSGTSGQGQGGVLLTGLQKWSELKQYTNATTEPTTKTDISRLYQADKANNIFTQYPWYEYNESNHRLYPNNNIYLITTDISSPNIVGSPTSPVYALQIVNYYNQAGVSGHPTLRWIDTAAPNNVREKTFDASKNWVYVDLKTGETTDKNGTWQIAISRNNVILNGGISGKGKVGGFLAKVPEKFYDDKGKPIQDKWQDSQNALQNINNYNKPSNRRGKGWVMNTAGSALSPNYKGSPETGLDYGWYVYTGINRYQGHPPHLFITKSENEAEGALIRGNTGKSYARMKVDKIEYLNKENTKWTIHFDVQPAS